MVLTDKQTLLVPMAFLFLFVEAVDGNLASQTLECYSCSGGEKCGVLFSPNSTNVNVVKRNNSEQIFSCSISVTPEGLTSRGIVPSYECRSSAYQFCCNENRCNTLPSPPLPAFTSLKCAIGKCSLSNGICVYEAEYVTTLSSPTESCSITFDRENYRYYKKGCQPTIKDSNAARLSAKPIKPDLMCCNSPECNTGHVNSPVKGVAIQCYTCDSRITGAAGCTIFNESHPHMMKAGSSSTQEACATIVGLEGRDPTTGKPYPAFTIRAIVSKCVTQPLGHISYGGAYFKGRMECCSSYFCNTKNLETKIKARKRRWIIPILVLATIMILIIGITIGITCAVYRYFQKKKKDRYGPVAVTETEIALDSLGNKFHEKKSSSQPAVTDYPDECVTP